MEIIIFRFEALRLDIDTGGRARGKRIHYYLISHNVSNKIVATITVAC